MPSGASTGEFEAVELRDGGDAWGGKGVTQAVANANGELAEAVDGPRRRRPGGAWTARCSPPTARPTRAAWAPTPSSASRWPSAKAAAAEAGQPLWRYLGGADARVLPVPMMNVLNGGAHADNKVDFQEFMVVPAGAPSFSEALRMGAEVFHALKKTLHDRGLGTAVGDEGGFAPDLGSNEEALRGADRGHRGGRATTPGDDVAIALDPATSEIFDGGVYELEHEGRDALARRDGRATGPRWPAVPDRLDRGRHGRGGLGRLEGAHRPDRRHASSWWATTCS